MKKLEFIACFVLFAGAIALGFGAVRGNWLATTPADVIEDYEDDITFIKDEVTDVCFSRNTHDGGMSLASCKEVEPHLNLKLAWMSKGIWYFRDMKRDICMASGIIRATLFLAPVPCSQKVMQLLGPAQGRYRMDTRLSRK